MKKHIGLIVPSSNTIIEVDYYRRLPKEYSLHVARMYLHDTTVAGEEEMLDVHFPKALYDLATVKPDVIVFGCTSAGALRGNNYDDELCKMIERVGNCKSVSVIRSVQEAIQKSKMERVLVLTPYIEELNERIAASLTEQGVEVCAIHGLGIDHNHSIGMVEPEQIKEFVIEKAAAHAGEFDGIFLSCTNFRAMDVYQELEQRLGLPIVTSNQAAYSKTLEKLR
jgi:maleate isomerase